MNAKRIREIRARLGLTQRELGELLNVSPRTVQDWEQGRHAPRSSAILLLELADRGLLTRAPRQGDRA
ncbi:MAG TPA: helix-turn-helix domain-containing protein [Burkholderiales bacterium]|nr:helix-turn-helix domain-containing protein [Burkholderiales bacterium]